MRISDWSSDVCSSDLPHLNIVTDADHIIGIELCRGLPGKCAREKVRAENIAFQIGGIVKGLRCFRLQLGHWLINDGGTLRRRSRHIQIGVGARKSVVWGRRW